MQPTENQLAIHSCVPIHSLGNNVLGYSKAMKSYMENFWGLELNIGPTQPLLQVAHWEFQEMETGILQPVFAQHLLTYCLPVISIGCSTRFSLIWSNCEGSLHFFDLYCFSGYYFPKPFLEHSEQRKGCYLFSPKTSFKMIGGTILCHPCANCEEENDF